MGRRPAIADEEDTRQSAPGRSWSITVGRLSLFLSLIAISPVSAQCGLFPPGQAPVATLAPALVCCKPCWGGIYPTVLTPWNCNGCGVDTAALAAEVQYQLCGGVHGLLLLGTLGEGMYASEQERAEVITTAVATVAGKVPVVVGIHTGDVQCALNQLHQAKALGAQAVLVKYLGPKCAPFCRPGPA